MSFAVNLFLIWLIIGFALFILVDALNLDTNAPDITVGEYLKGFYQEYLKQPKMLFITMFLWPLCLPFYWEIYREFKARHNER